MKVESVFMVLWGREWKQLNSPDPIVFPHSMQEAAWVPNVSKRGLYLIWRANGWRWVRVRDAVQLRPVAEAATG